MKKSFFLILLLVSLVSTGQELSTTNRRAQRDFEEAKEYYINNDPLNALSKLKEALREDTTFTEAYLLEADIYGESNSYEMQIQSLEKAIQIDKNIIPKSYYILGNAYYHTGLYSKALETLQKYLELKTDTLLDAKALARVKQYEFAETLVSNPVAFKAKNLGDAINSQYDDYWPSLTIDGKTMVFTRLSPFWEWTDKLNSRYQEDFYVSQYSDGKWQKAEPMSSINTAYNEGAQSISADGKLIFFTACTQSDSYGSCDIYFTREIQGIWSTPQNVGAPVSSSSWESQPSISANGKYLYFVSNREGGLGGMDLWRCRLYGFNRLGNPVWGTPENLGDSINTSGNEMSPFIHADNRTLYFASDKWPGLGGIDLFYSRLIDDSTWCKPINLGYPINTQNDEQGLIVDARGENAYYSSDRVRTKGMDLYSFDLYPEAQPNPVSYVKGHVTNIDSKRPLVAEVQLMDIEKNTVISTNFSDIDGEFLMCLPLGTDYAFNVSKNGYLFYSENFSLTNARSADDPFIVNIELKPLEVGNSTILRNIFFESGSFEILDNSKSELQKLINFLNDNPTLKIEIEGHTDNVGSESYNMTLSENRAKSVYNYLVNSGISGDRLSYKGYGMSSPLTTNQTSEGRAQNRRTEFTIISLQ